MYFKKLELIGFKSFADKTTLYFETGVTAIVGPNGCGKSNLADAIRWVLGETSAKMLRSSRMEDVIFNGTDSKKAVNLAEVSLTLCNEGKLLPIDYDEVTVKRRIFRSGESEYYLNKTQVRLKDIVELFMGTGIGTNAYSLIEQGQVDFILSPKSEERRFIFDEASGITKYKAKKKEALRKLEQTEGNLLRIGDVIAEVKRQINSIERQAAKARRYKEEFERLKELELRASRFEYKGLLSRKDSYRTELESLKKKEESFVSNIDFLNKKLGKIRIDLEELDRQLSQAQARSMETDANIDRNNDKIVMDKERIEELGERYSSLGREIDSIGEKKSAVADQIERLSSELSSLFEQEALKEELLKQKEGYLAEVSNRIKDSEQIVSRTKVSIVDIMAEGSKVRNDLVRISANLQNCNARSRRLKVERQKVLKEISDLDEKISVILSRIDEVKASVDVLNRKRADCESRAERLDRECHLTEGLLQDMGRRLTASESRLEFLEDLKRRYEGFSRGVKSVLIEMDNGTLPLKGICGAVANLIEVSDGYEVLVEAALGGSVQAVIVESVGDAREAVRYLRDNNLGVATFLPLDIIEEKTADRTKDIDKASTLGKAIDFIKVDPKYKPALSNLLRNTFLVKDLDSALKLLGRIKGDVKLVTLNGEVVENGSVSGGSLPLAEGGDLIGRDAKIKALRKECLKLKEDISKLEQIQAKRRQELGSIQKDREAILKSLRGEEINLANRQVERSNIESEKKRLQDEISLLDLEIEEAEREGTELKSRNKDLKDLLAEIEEKNASMQDLITANQDFIASGSRQREELLVEIAQIKAELSSLKERQDSRARSLKSSEESINELALSLKLKEKEKQESLSKKVELEAEIIRLEGEIQTLLTDRQALKRDSSDLQDRRRCLAESIAETEDRIREGQKELEEIRGSTRNLDIKDTEVSFKMEGLRDRLREAYNVDLLEPGQSLEEGLEEDWERINEDISRLKSRIESMGPVNLVAIEEEQELRERFAFLTAQREDLLHANESLLKAINKINRTTKDLFMETFEKIQVEFKDFYRLLFGGGNAEITLVDQGNILESPVEIMACPPGKRLQNISLLSGGEKALTAIALLFAIFKVKPSPFCVMDEIDATLDEANINRFTRVLQDFVRTSQFIIITHSKRTIGMADVMYGVTMEESGVSRLVSVKFTENSVAQK